MISVGKVARGSIQGLQKGLYRRALMVDGASSRESWCQRRLVVERASGRDC